MDLDMKIEFAEVTWRTLLLASMLSGALGTGAVTLLKDAAGEVLHTFKYHRALLRVLSLVAGLAFSVAFWWEHSDWWLWSCATGIFGGGSGTASYAILKGAGKSILRWRKVEDALEAQRALDAKGQGQS